MIFIVLRFLLNFLFGQNAAITQKVMFISNSRIWLQEMQFLKKKFSFLLLVSKITTIFLFVISLLRLLLSKLYNSLERVQCRQTEFTSSNSSIDLHTPCIFSWCETYLTLYFFIESFLFSIPFFFSISNLIFLMSCMTFTVRVVLELLYEDISLKKNQCLFTIPFML